MSSLARPTVALCRQISSIGFSGAGFLAAYHLGAAQCLLDQNILYKGDDCSSLLPMTGVSAGALVAAAMSLNIRPEDGMELTLQVARQTRQSAGYLEALAPGFSLVDVVETHLKSLLQNLDEEEFLQGLQDGRIVLRIGLTDRRVFFPMVGPNESRATAFCYVDRFRSLQDVVAACILSSYIPGITGPSWGSKDAKNSAVARAARLLKGMIRDGCVKRASANTGAGEPITIAAIDPSNDDDNNDNGREICWDGGLVNAFPYIDKDTLIVTPVAATFHKHASINPGIVYNTATDVRTLRLNRRIALHATSANMQTFSNLLRSSSDDVLQQKYAEGYDNALYWLRQNNLVSFFRGPTTSSTSPTAGSVTTSTTTMPRIVTKPNVQ